MTERKATHDAFSIERTYSAAPARVFRAWSDPTAKAQWFAGPADQCLTAERISDFRVGGRDRVVTPWKSGPASRFDCHYWDIVPNERIVYAYEMHLGDRKISVSLATVEFKPNGAGTRLVVTEQGVFLDGYEDNGSREQGTADLLDNFEKHLRENAA